MKCETLSFSALDAANLGTTLVVLGGTTRLASNTAKGLPGEKKKRKRKSQGGSRAIKRASVHSRRPKRPQPRKHRRIGDYEVTGRGASLL